MCLPKRWVVNIGTIFNTFNMKTNKILSFILSVAALSFVTTACEEEKEDFGAPSIELGQSDVEFEKDGGAKTVSVTATRDWKATTEQDWISIEPREGKASSQPVTVEIKVIENSGVDREGAVKFDIGFDAKSLSVKQKGTGSAEALIVYRNDFDKTEATKTYGTSGSSWPYLDQFDGWKNATGTGAGSESYEYNAMSTRANSMSNSNYSDYTGSGSNNLFFGSGAWFSVTGIKLGQSADYSLTFGAEKYSQDNGSLFKHDEFHVYVSDNGKKWVELQYSFPDGDKEGRWDLATSNFTVPSGTETLCIYVKTDVASSYRIDDLCLTVASAAGTVIDFSKGVDLGTGGGENPGSDYDKAASKTVKDFIAAASTTTYYKLKGKVSGFNAQYCSFDLTDETGSIYVYSVDAESKSAYSDKIKDGGTVELAGVYKDYNGKNEVVNAHILSFSESSGGEARNMTIAEALAAPAGTAAIVNGTVAATYKRGFIITDGTDYLLVYDGTKCAAKEKDNVKVTGTISSYGGLVQLASPEVTVVSSGNTLTLPTPKVLDGAAFNSYSSSKIEYISYEGTLTVSGDYYNVAVEGATALTGSLAYVNDSFNAASFDKTVVKVTGFFVGISGSSTKYLSTMVTELVPGSSEYLMVGTTALSAAADATSATFEVKANVAWTVTSDNTAYTVEPASGDKNATVTVKFPANTEEAAKTVRFTVSTTADVATKSHTVTLTHRGKSSQGGAEVTVSANMENLSDYNNGKLDDVISWTNDSEYDPAVTLTQLRIYKNMHLTIKAADGYTISKVEFTCTANCDAKYGFDTDKSLVAVDSGASVESSGSGKVGTITVTGNTSSVTYTASKNQMRVTKLTVTYKPVE